MFHEDGTLIGCWDCNDACWRNEYFSPMMKALGITIVKSNDKKLINKLMAAFGG
jgi:hypothetical protein